MKRAAPPLESAILASILHLLAVYRIYARRINVGMVPVAAAGGVAGFRRSTMSGISDVIGVLPGGRFLAIEVKRPGGKTTPQQEEFLERVNAAGGLAFVATSSRDVEERLREFVRASRRNP